MAKHRRSRTERAIEAITGRLAAATGEEFFHQLVDELSTIIDADCAFIGEVVDSGDTVRALAVRMDGDGGEPFEYELANTPCEGVVGRGLCVHSESVAAKFPQDELLAEMGVESYVGMPLVGSEDQTLGLLVALWRTPLDEPQTAAGVLQLFAVRASAELERIRGQERLERTMQRYRVLIEQSSDLIMIVDRQGEILYESPAVERLLGYTPEERVGHSSFELIHPDDVGSVRRTFETAVRTGQEVISHELRARHKGGDWVHFEVRGRNLLDHPAVHGFVVAARDVTERRQLEAELRHSQRLEALGRVAGGVAHDFNNLLTAITGFSDLLLSRCEDDHPWRSELEEIARAGERGAALTAQLLAFSRRQVLRPEVVAVNSVIQDLDRMLRRVLGEQIEMVVDLDPDAGTVRVDPGQLEQVLMNLVINARDAMPQGGTLTIATEQRSAGMQLASASRSGDGDPHVAISVSDTGEGIDPSVRDRIFEPFFTTKGRDEGTGLGLSTAYGVVKQSGGWIEVDTEKARGSTFTIYLPEAASVETEASVLDQEVASGGGETILVVEDEVAVRGLMKTVLETAGYEVLVASDADAAVQCSRQHSGPIDLLVTDVVMPGRSGPEVAAALRRERSDLRVLYVSGYTDDEMLKHGGLDATVPLLPKPFDGKTLLEAVRSRLASRARSTTRS